MLLRLARAGATLAARFGRQGGKLLTLGVGAGIGAEANEILRHDKVLVVKRGEDGRVSFSHQPAAPPPPTGATTAAPSWWPSAGTAAAGLVAGATLLAGGIVVVRWRWRRQHQPADAPAQRLAINTSAAQVGGGCIFWFGTKFWGLPHRFAWLRLTHGSPVQQAREDEEASAAASSADTDAWAQQLSECSRRALGLMVERDGSGCSCCPTEQALPAGGAPRTPSSRPPSQAAPDSPLRGLSQALLGSCSSGDGSPFLALRAAALEGRVGAPGGSGGGGQGSPPTSEAMPISHQASSIASCPEELLSRLNSADSVETAIVDPESVSFVRDEKGRLVELGRGAFSRVGGVGVGGSGVGQSQ